MQVDTKRLAGQAIDHEADPPLPASPMGASKEAFRESLSAAKRVNSHHADGQNDEVPRLAPIGDDAGLTGA